MYPIVLQESQPVETPSTLFSRAHTKPCPAGVDSCNGGDSGKPTPRGIACPYVTSFNDHYLSFFLLFDTTTIKTRKAAWVCVLIGIPFPRSLSSVNPCGGIPRLPVYLAPERSVRCPKVRNQESQLSAIMSWRFDRALHC